MTSLPPRLASSSTKRRFFVFLKLASIGALILLLHIPLAMTRGVLRERQAYRTEATEAIVGVWGRQQLVAGPVLAIPYVYRTIVVRTKLVNGNAVQVEERDLVEAVAYFLPEELAIRGTAEPEVRHRGIFEAVVYSANLTLEGFFQPDFAVTGIAAERIDWEKAKVFWGVSDLRGMRAVRAMTLGENQLTFDSSEGLVDAPLPLVAPAPGVTGGAKLKFAMDVAVQGSEQLSLAPVGRITRATLEAGWPDPSFAGAALPMSRAIGGDGFRATWESSHLSRGFPQSWSSRAVGPGEMMRKIEEASFGVRFAQPVDGYSMTQRAQKYGTLFFVLVFAVFFLFEVTASLKIHPLQYALVGAALCLFFLGFLALSEFWPVGVAYGTAAGACTLMIALYAHSFLRTGRRTQVILGGLGATYGYLYLVLKSQDYALIAGTAALFAVLALVMFCTRRINWYAMDDGDAVDPRMNAKARE